MTALTFSSQLPQGFFGELDHFRLKQRWPAVVPFAQRVLTTDRGPFVVIHPFEQAWQPFRFRCV
jgi:hypothetical protein